MRILIASDSFKNCGSAAVVCDSIAAGLIGPDVELDICPLSDGGEGMLDVIALATAVKREYVTVLGPLGNTVRAELGWLWQPNAGLPSAADGSVAIVESAQAIGLGLVPKEQLNPLLATSYGLGQMIDHALQRGARSIVVGLGGSATVDGGLGMAQALGARFQGATIPASGKDLCAVSAELTLPERARWQARVFIASDVRNPLLGSSGAATVFGPQKGATPDMVARLERDMAHFAPLLFEACRHRRMGKMGFREAAESPGAGAAGGIGFALQQLFDATTLSGVEWVMQRVGFDERLAQADLIITGEGRLDQSSFAGKVVSGVLSGAERRRVPVAVICGTNTLQESDWAPRGIAHVQSLTDLARSAEDSRARAGELLGIAAALIRSRTARLLKS